MLAPKTVASRQPVAVVALATSSHMFNEVTTNTIQKTIDSASSGFVVIWKRRRCFARATYAT